MISLHFREKKDFFFGGGGNGPNPVQVCKLFYVQKKMFLVSALLVNQQQFLFCFVYWINLVHTFCLTCQR